MSVRVCSRIARVALALCIAWLAGCAVLPERGPLPEQHAIADGASTTLGRIAAASLPADSPKLSGFRLLPEAETAFNARVALARRAEKSLDVQYYLLAGDEIGRLFLRELRDAAARGVRVRLLVDDLYTGNTDALLVGLAAQPNVEVRLFNPLPVRGGSLAGRVLGSLHEFGRVNHRMHNKLFVVDDSIAVSGGRNIANEYFMRDPEANFIDVDVMLAGPVVHRLSAVFDTYWNSSHVYPVARVAAPPVDAEAARRRFDELVNAAVMPVVERPRDVLGQTPVAEQLDSGWLTHALAEAQVFADSPDKVAGVDRTQSTVSSQTLALFGTARQRVDITSPYFIPGPRGMKMIEAVGATQENGRITLVTNALAATDEPLVHARYAQYRRQLLKAGVRIYELSPTLSRRTPRLGQFGPSFGRLHAKVSVIDRRWVFVGSMNLDARSARVNTEVGVAIDSPELARQLSGLFQGALSKGAYRLRLAPDGERIEWIETAEDGREIVHTEEPDDHWLRRMKLWLMGLFVSDDLL